MPKLYVTSRRIEKYGFRMQGALPPIDSIGIDMGSPRGLIEKFIEKFVLDKSAVSIENRVSPPDDELLILASINRGSSDDEIDISFWQVIDEDRCPAAMEQLKLTARLLLYQKKA